MTDLKEKKDTSIDWDQVRRRMESATRSTTKERSPGDDEKKRILRQRARALAAEPERRESREQLELVRFVLAGENYAFESRYVREVHPLRDYTPVPCTPAFVLGIVNVRGEILSIIDIRKFFGLREERLSDLNRVIVLSSGEMTIGILADAIVGIDTLPLQAIKSSPVTFTGLGREYLKGVTAEGIAILDAGKIISDKRIIVNEFV